MVISAPTTEWIQQDISINPSGFRADHDPTKGFIKVLGTGPGAFMDFGSINTTISGSISPTKLAYFRVSNFHDASGVFNMRFFIKNFSDFKQGNYRFLGRRSLDFVSNLQLSEADQNIPITIPTQQNYKSTRSTNFPRGGNAISGIKDDDCGQYSYIAIFADTDVNLGQKTFTMRLLYDYS